MSAWRHKTRRDIGTGHVDDWLMTYADMITLLLCFFAVFLAVSIPKKAQFEKARKKMIEQFAGQEQKIDILEGQFPVHRGPPMANPEQAIGANEAMPAIVGQAGLEKPVKPNPPPEKGDRITTLDISSASAFPSGSADLSEQGKEILGDLLTKLRSDEYKDYTVTVEGHTDDVPIKTLQFPSNWELSTARAAAVVRYLIEQGISPERLRASGYADTFPKVPNRNANGDAIPENQAQNRRVVIKMEKIDKSKLPDQPVTSAP